MGPVSRVWARRRRPAGCASRTGRMMRRASPNTGTAMLALRMVVTTASRPTSPLIDGADDQRRQVRGRSDDLELGKPRDLEDDPQQDQEPDAGERSTGQRHGPTPTLAAWTPGCRAVSTWT